MIAQTLQKLLLLAAILAAFAVPVAAQQPVTLSGDVKLEKTVTDANGMTRIELVTPEVVVPGDRLIFGTDYQNVGAETVTDFVMTNPLPEAVMLAPGSDPTLIVSADGGKTWGVLADLKIALAEGGTRPAGESDVTHVRWVLAKVESGERGRVKFRAVVR